MAFRHPLTVLTETPLDPSTPTARSWLEAELAKREYADGRSLIERLADWLGELLSRASDAGGALPTWVLNVLLVVVAVIAVTLVVLLVRREPLTRRSRGRAVVDDPRVTARDHRARADAALAAGRWNDAAVSSYRAVAVSGVERTILDERPGRTALEVARELAPAFPDERRALAAAADTFDLVRYGERDTTETAARAIHDLDGRLVAARPLFEEAVAP